MAQERPPGKPPLRLCAACGQVFEVPSRSQKLTCGIKCARAYSTKKKADWRRRNPRPYVNRRVNPCSVPGCQKLGVARLCTAHERQKYRQGAPTVKVCLSCRVKADVHENWRGHWLCDDCFLRVQGEKDAVAARKRARNRKGDR